MYFLAQAGSSLQRIDEDGSVTTLALPSGVTIDPTVRGIFAVLGDVIIFAKASSINLLIDPVTFTVSGMSLQQPLSPPTLSAGSGSGLTGIYKAKVAYATKDSNGNVINQSPLSQESAPLTITNKNIVYTNIPISPSASVNCRILYRTVAGGSVYFQFLEIDDNVSTTATDGTLDAALALLAAPDDIANAPGSVPGTQMRLLIEWKGRLWGVSNTPGERDDARFTSVGVFYAWDPFNSIPARPKGEDEFGIVAFVRRRDDLGMLKRSRIMKIIGDSPADFEVLALSENVGCIAPDSVVVIRNKAYWLSHDGVYRWDDSGVECISKASVDGWFTQDTVFNRDRFEFAFAGWNILTNAYELSLAAVGSDVEDRWIAFHIDANNGQGEWLGPHLTTAFTPTARVSLTSDKGIAVPAIGGDDGYLYLQNQIVPNDIEGDDTVHLITAHCRDRFLHEQAPNVTHMWGRVAVLSRVETAGSLNVTPYVGGTDAAAQSSIAFDLTRGQQIGRRAGVGRLCSIEFSQAVVNQRFLVYGYEIVPVFEVGVR